MHVLSIHAGAKHFYVSPGMLCLLPVYPIHRSNPIISVILCFQAPNLEVASTDAGSSSAWNGRKAGSCFVLDVPRPKLSSHNERNLGSCHALNMDFHHAGDVQKEVGLYVGLRLPKLRQHAYVNSK